MKSCADVQEPPAESSLKMNKAVKTIDAVFIVSWLLFFILPHLFLLLFLLSFVLLPALQHRPVTLSSDVTQAATSLVSSPPSRSPSKRFLFSSFRSSSLFLKLLSAPVRLLLTFPSSRQLLSRSVRFKT